MELVNIIANMTKPLTPKQLFLADLEPKTSYKPNFLKIRAIGSYYKVLIPLEQRSKL